jgi:hypothetical protein
MAGVRKKGRIWIGIVSAGTIDVVLPHDLPELVRSALKMLVHLKKRIARQKAVFKTFRLPCTQVNASKVTL